MRYQQPQFPTLLDASNSLAARVIGGCVPGVFSLRNGGSSSVKALGLNPWGRGSAGGSGNYATASAAEVLKGRAAGASASNRDITFVFAGTVTSNNTIWFYDGQSDGSSSWWFKTDASGNLSASYGQSSNIAGTVPIPTGFVVLICHGGTNGGQVARTWVNGVEYAGTAATDSWTNSPAFTGMFGSAAYPTSNTFAGVGNFAVALRGNITSAEAKDLTNNLWQLFEDDDEDAIFLTPLAGSSYSYSATGGMQLGGASALIRGSVQAPSGGIQLGGSSAEARGKIAILGGGGAILGGAATQVRGREIAASGGTILGGAASIVRAAIKAATGGIQLGGAASVSFTSAIQSLVVNAVGGMLLAGAAGVQRTVTASLTAGGLLFGGSAGAYIGGQIGNWLQLARRRGNR